MYKIFCATLLTWVLTPAAAQQSVTSVVLPDSVPFSNKESIPAAVVNECDLPNRQAQALLAALAKNGIEAKPMAGPVADAGDNVLQLEITDVISKGHPSFIGAGHSRQHKSITVVGRLYQGGKLAASFTSTRVSGGGLFSGYKSSCAVLGRCAEAIGEDVVNWLKAPLDGAKLGDQPQQPQAKP